MADKNTVLTLYVELPDNKRGKVHFSVAGNAITFVAVPTQDSRQEATSLAALSALLEQVKSQDECTIIASQSRSELLGGIEVTDRFKVFLS